MDEKWSPIPPDTDPEAWRLQGEAYRRLTGSERLAIALRLTEMARLNAQAGIRARHPDYDDEQVKRAYLRLVHGDEVCLAVWPGQPLVDP